MSLQTVDGCYCGDCDGGCDNVGLNKDADGDPICDECEMGMHRQDREKEPQDAG